MRPRSLAEKRAITRRFEARWLPLLKAGRLRPVVDSIFPFERVAEVVLELRAVGLSVTRIDLGGGIGVHYHAERPLDPISYANLVRDIFGSLGLTLAFEPGRVLAARRRRLSPRRAQRPDRRRSAKR